MSDAADKDDIKARLKAEAEARVRSKMAQKREEILIAKREEEAAAALKAEAAAVAAAEEESMGQEIEQEEVEQEEVEQEEVEQEEVEQEQVEQEEVEQEQVEQEEVEQEEVEQEEEEQEEEHRREEQQTPEAAVVERGRGTHESQRAQSVKKKPRPSLAGGQDQNRVDGDQNTQGRVPPRKPAVPKQRQNKPTERESPPARPRNVPEARKPGIPQLSKHVHYRNALVSFFETHAPQKLNNKGVAIDKLLAAHKNNEAELFLALEEKYGKPVECAIAMTKMRSPTPLRRGGDESGFTNCRSINLEEDNTSASSTKAAIPILSVHGARRSVLQDYFSIHKPERVDMVDKLLASYKGREQELCQKLEEKYGAPVSFAQQKRKEKQDETGTTASPAGSAGETPPPAPVSSNDSSKRISRRRMEAEEAHAKSHVGQQRPNTASATTSFNKQAEKEARMVKVVAQPVLAKRDREILELQRKVARLETANTDLTAELDALLDPANKVPGEVEAQLAETAAKLAESEALLANAEADKAALSEKCRSLEEQVGQLTGELEAGAEGDLEIASLNERLMAMKEEFGTVKAELAQSEERNAALQATMESDNEARERDYKAMFDQNAQLQESNTAFSEELSQLQPQLNEKTAFIIELEESLKEAEESLKEATAAAQAATDSSTAQEEESAAVEQLRQENLMLEETASQLKFALADLENALADKERAVQSRAREITELKAQLEATSG